MNNVKTFFLSICILFCILLFCAKEINAVENTETCKYEYQIKHIDSKDSVKFYFFRTDTATGRIEILAYDDTKSDATDWYPIKMFQKDKRDIFVFFAVK